MSVATLSADEVAAPRGRPRPLLSALMPRLYGLHFLNDGLQGALLILLPTITRQLGLDERAAGWIVFSHFLIGALLAMSASAAARAVGKWRLMLLGLACGALCFAAASAVGGFTSLWLVYLAAGAAFGFFHPVAFGLVAGESKPRSMGRSMGLFTAAGDVGRVITVAAVLAMLAIVPWRELCMALGLAVACGIFSLAVQAKGTRVSDAVAPRTSWRLNVQVDPSFWLLCAVGFLDGLATSALAVFLPFLLSAKGYEPSTQALLLPLFFASCLLGRVVIGWLGDPLGQRASLIGCDLAVGLAMLGLCFSHGVLGVGLTLLLLGVFSRGSLPLVLSMTAERVPADRLGSAFAMNQLVLGAATTLSPLLMGQISAAAGTTVAFAVGGGLALAAAVLVGCWSGR